jgi:hypothetical protein
MYIPSDVTLRVSAGYPEVSVSFIGSVYSRTPLIRINWDGEPSGYAENTDNWIFLLQVGYIRN